jgi:hypothetical protein
VLFRSMWDLMVLPDGGGECLTAAVEFPALMALCCCGCWSGSRSACRWCCSAQAWATWPSGSQLMQPDVVMQWPSEGVAPASSSHVRRVLRVDSPGAIAAAVSAAAQHQQHDGVTRLWLPVCSEHALALAAALGGSCLAWAPAPSSDAGGTAQARVAMSLQRESRQHRDSEASRACLSAAMTRQPLFASVAAQAGVLPRRGSGRLTGGQHAVCAAALAGMMEWRWCELGCVPCVLGLCLCCV